MANMITATKAAEILGVSRMRVNQLINEGRLKAERVGKYWAVDEAAVLERARVVNGVVVHGGRRYTLLYEAVYDGDRFFAEAICDEDERGEGGELPLYFVEWDVEGEDASGEIVADWDAPRSIEQRDSVRMAAPSLEEQKWEEVQALSKCGKYPGTYAANLKRIAALPDSLLDKLDAAELAALVDAFDDCHRDGQRKRRQ